MLSKGSHPRSPGDWQVYEDLQRQGRIHREYPYLMGSSHTADVLLLFVASTHHGRKQPASNVADRIGHDRRQQDRYQRHLCCPGNLWCGGRSCSNHPRSVSRFQKTTYQRFPSSREHCPYSDPECSESTESLSITGT